MSYKQRERKRMQRARVAATPRGSASAGQWWLTLTKQDTCCARCGGVLRVPRPMVYRHRPLECLCQPCADNDPSIRYRPSSAWVGRRRRGRGSRKHDTGSRGSGGRPGKKPT